MTVLPPPTVNPCNDCPWRRGSDRGWLGPLSADEWLAVAHSDLPVACHKTLVEDEGWAHDGARQCRGAAIFRANVFKLPRDRAIETGPRDIERVFATNDEFRAHHDSPLADWLTKGREERRG